MIISKMPKKLREELKSIDEVFKESLDENDDYDKKWEDTINTHASKELKQYLKKIELVAKKAEEYDKAHGIINISG